MDFFRDFSLKKSTNITDSTAPTQKIKNNIVWEVCVMGFFAKYYLNLTVQGNGRKFEFCLTKYFFGAEVWSVILAAEHKLTQTTYQFKKVFWSVISDPCLVTVANPIQVSNFWHFIRNCWRKLDSQNCWLDISQNCLSMCLSFLAYFWIENLKYGYVS